MTSSADQTPAAETTPGRDRRRPRWWLGLAVFVVGVAVGVLLVGLLNTTTPDFDRAAGEPGAGTGGQPAPVPTGGVPVAARAEVNASCLRVINQAQDIYGILQGVDQAVVEVNLQQLDDMVRRLQPIQPRLAQDLQDCRVDAEAVVTPPATTPAPPTASPTG